MRKYGTTRQATNDSIIRRMRYACWLPKATDTHSEYVITYCFPTAKMVAREHLNIALYVRCLSILSPGQCRDGTMRQ